MTHDELKDALPALALGALDAVEQDAVRDHVNGCAECQRELAALGRVVETIGLDATPVTPPASLKGKVMARIAAGGAPNASVKPEPMRWIVPIALAASLALAVGAGLYARALSREIAELRLTVRVMRAPDLVRAELKGQESAAGATGRAFWSRANGLVFSAERLPALPPGRVYQLWTITGSAATSAGLLQLDPRGTASLMLMTVDGARPDAFGVTIEPAGGSASPTLPIVMVGTAGQ